MRIPTAARWRTDGGQTQLNIPNDHLQYAITWFLLALSLAGVYLAYHWEHGRLTLNGRTKQVTLCAEGHYPMIANDPYVELEKRFARMSAIHRAGAILNWDRSTMMPEGASADRAEQLATLAVLGHEAIVAPDMSDLLARAGQGQGTLDSWQQANLREMNRAWVHQNALPADLVEARAKAASACEMAWREARKNADYKSLIPTLTEVLAVTRRIGEAKGAALGVSLYDALLDEFEPAGRASRVDRLFAELRSFLPDLLGRVLERQRSLPAPLPLEGPFPVEAQRRLGEGLIRAIGFDFNARPPPTSPPILSPAARPTMCASPRATTRPISPAP